MTQELFSLMLHLLSQRPFIVFMDGDCFTHQENTVDLGAVIQQRLDDSEAITLVLEKDFYRQNM